MSKYDINTHGDFKRYFDTTQKRNYWVLGYFGGGSVNVVELYELAKEMATKLKVPLESIYMDEILHSRRHKHFKFLVCQHPTQEPDRDCTHFMNNVYAWLTD